MNQTPQIATATTSNPDRKSAAEEAMHARLGNIPTRLARAMIGLGRELGHLWAQELRSEPQTAPIRLAEWIDAHDIVRQYETPNTKATSAVEPFPRTYSDESQRIHWAIEHRVRDGVRPETVLRVEITRQWPTVKVLQAALRSATNERDDMGPNLCEDASGKTFDALKAAQDALQVALDNPNLKRGEVVCSINLHEDGSSSWGMMSLRAEGRHWRRLTKLIAAAGYSLPYGIPLQQQFRRSLEMALKAMINYETLAEEARRHGYEVPQPHSDSLYAWELWGLNYQCQTAALTSWIGEQVETLGGRRPPEGVLKLWYTTFRGDDSQIAAILKGQQGPERSARPRLPSVNPALS